MFAAVAFPSLREAEGRGQEWGVMPGGDAKPLKADKRVPRARSLRRAMTDAERKLWWRLRGLKIDGSHFRRQATIGPYYADFACHEHRLVIEVDGGGHAEETRVIADRARTDFLVSCGYRVMRFWNHDVLKDTEAVMETVNEALQRPPTPNPSPPRANARGGRGTQA